MYFDEFAESKLFAVLVGAFLGWFVKYATDHFNGRAESRRALHLLEGELSVILDQAITATAYMEQAREMEILPNTEGIEKVKEAAQKLLKAMPSIETYGKRFDAIDNAFNKDEKMIVLNVVTFYNSMRKAFEGEPLPLRNIMNLEDLIKAKRQMIAPFSDILHPIQYWRAKIEVWKAIARIKMSASDDPESPLAAVNATIRDARTQLRQQDNKQEES